MEQRETLSGKVHYLELRLAEKDEEIKILTRKNMLETKNYKTQLINEQKKCKEFQKQLEKFNSSSTIDSGYDTVKVSIFCIIFIIDQFRFIFFNYFQSATQPNESKWSSKNQTHFYPDH